MIGLVFIKVVATAFNGSGGLEVFSLPSLFTGGVTGFLIAYLINMTGVITVPVSYFVLAGMAGGDVGCHEFSVDSYVPDR